MTTLAHDCAILGIPVDTGRLFDGDDPLYELWLSGLVDRVTATKRAIAKQRRTTTTTTR